MPEICIDYDNNSNKSTINEVTESKQQFNWNRSNSIDASNIPHVNRRHFVVPLYSEENADNQNAYINHNILAAAPSRNNFCCCSRNSVDYNSCWKVKRKQIIWESSHASAKNRTTTAKTSTTTTTTTPTLTTSLLPTATVTRTWSNRSVECNKVTIVATIHKDEERYCSNIATRQANKLPSSTSLPATPNLSQLRRPQRMQYKKLSLECGEYAADDIVVPQQQHQQQQQQQHQYQQQYRQQFANTIEQLKMSATKLQTYASARCTSGNDTKPMMLQQHHQQQQHDLIIDNNNKMSSIPAVISSVPNQTVEQIVAKNNNNESLVLMKDASVNSAATLLTTTKTMVAGTTISTQTQTDMALFSSHNVGSCKNNNNSHSAISTARLAQQQPPPLHTTTTTTTTSMAGSSAGGGGSVGVKSSLAFCEHCCESASVLSTLNEQAANNTEEDSGRYYRAHTDSVSDLSSYRFVSDEDDIISARTVNETQENQQHQQQQVNTLITNTSLANVSSHSSVPPPPSPLPTTNARSPLSPPPPLALALPSPTKQKKTRTSPTVCCYTIDKPAALQYSATVVEYLATATAPVPIPHHTNRKVVSDESPEGKKPASELFHLQRSAESLLSTSLPSNYGRKSSLKKRRIPSSPPPVPPKPKQQQQQHHETSTPNSGVKLQENEYSSKRGGSARFSNRSVGYSPTRLDRSIYDPNSFHRKVQKFEKQNTLIGEANYSISTSPASFASSSATPADIDIVEHTQPHLLSRSFERSLSPEHCELLNCFGTVKNTRPELSKTHNSDIAFDDDERKFVARSLSESSCCSAAPIANEKCAINKNNKHHHLNNNNNNNGNSNTNNKSCHVKSVASKNSKSKISQSVECVISKTAEANNNYNCKIKVVRDDNKQHQLPVLSSSYSSLSSLPLPKRTLRYDSYGRLKSERISHLPTAVVSNGRNKPLSETTRVHREPQNVAIAATFRNNSNVLPAHHSVYNSSVAVGDNKLTPISYRKLNYLSDKVEEFTEEFDEELENSLLPTETNGFDQLNINNNPISATIITPAESSTTSLITTFPITIQSDLDLSFTSTQQQLQNEEEQQQQQQIFKSLSDTNQFPSKSIQETINDPERCFSDSSSLKSSFPNSDSSIPCKCYISKHSSCPKASPTSPLSPTSPTSPLTPIDLNHKNSQSLPSVKQHSSSNDGTQSPIWLSSETIESRYSDHKYLDDVQSNCSDQTTIFHLDNDCSLSASSSSPSSHSVGNTILRGPLILKRIPAIQSFGYIPTHSGSLGSANVREYIEKEINMEKRRNTLDRFQRLGFGRKSSANTASQAAQQESSASTTTRNRKSSEKSERLKELTELLRGNRSSPTPPPVPPPRKPRNGCQSASNSIERSDTQAAATTPTPTTASIDSAPLSFMSTRSDDIMLMDQDEQTANAETTKTKNATTSQTSSTTDNLQKLHVSSDATADFAATGSSHSASPSARSTTTRLYDMLKPNTSLSNFESMIGREKSKSPPPILEMDGELAASRDIATKLNSPESRTVIGSYTQKGIPFRSASFSQIDVSSGKYKKSSWSALRDRLRRDKSVEEPIKTSESGVCGSANSNSSSSKKKNASNEKTTLESPGAAKAKSEPDWIYIPLKKKTEMSINLNYGQEVKTLENVIESPDGMPEEDIFRTDESETASNMADECKESLAYNIVVAHAKMESLTDTIQSDNDYTITDEPQTQVPTTVESANLTEKVNPSEEIADKPKPDETLGEERALDIMHPNLATLVEEQMPLESPPDNFLQTATTCLIPVPVYECAAQEWSLENPPQEWVEVAPEEFGIIPETIEPLISLKQCAIAKAEAVTEQEYRSDNVPTISVSRSSEEADDKSILRRKAELLATAEKDTDSEKETVELRQDSSDFPPVEVKKRYSHDDIEIGTEIRSSLDSIATRHSTDERKRIDKSKRRKGMYIDNAAWSDSLDSEPSAGGLALDISRANFNVIKPESPEECGIMYINSPPTDEIRTPGSLYSFDLNTPEYECKEPPVWTKADRLTSFSCHSSEEKEDMQCPTSAGGGGSGDAGIQVAGLKRQQKSFPFLRTDSVSDNESDRTPPPSRDRASPSPASSDYDFKRYSKRPLRGPYGQMLEAEMNKPNKMHFEEILEELRESDPTLQPRRQRGAHDDAGGVRNIPHYSNSMRVRKTNTYLPVPAHTRAASTPSQIENVSKSGGGSGSSVGIDKINPHEKHYLSTLDNSIHHHEVLPTGEQQQQQNHQPHLSNHHQREMKRAASEAPAPKGHHNKRSQSMGGEKLTTPTTHVHQQKRSLDANTTMTTVTATTATTAKDNNGKGNGGATTIKPTQQLLEDLLKGSSEKLLSEQRQQMFADTRTHVVQEIFRNEQSYVESLQIVVVKYLKVLKSPEHAGMIDSRTVDEIFFMVPDILEIHEKFLSELRSRLDSWDTAQKVGDAFMETFSKLEVLEVYTSFVNNCNRAKNAIRSTKHQRPSFAKFLETTAREHKGKLTLDNLLIKPVQKFPNYEMLFQRLIKHTDHDHPDQKHLQDVLKLVHDILVHINCKEREILENGQREATLRELEGVIEGIADLIAADRQFLLFDLVSMPSGQGARKERGFFIFNDLLVLTSIKKRSGTIRKPNTSTCPGTVATTLDTNKYKFLTKISLDCLEIVKTKDENVKRIMNEIENLADDCNKMQQIANITASLKYPHQYLEDVIRELHRDVQRQLSERQTNDAQLNMLELTVNSPNGSQKLSIVFSKAEKRTQWEETFNEAKQKLAATLERHPIPEFLMSIPIRKTRAGLQFTCAAATISEKRDVWVCNSDGYVGQVCIMSLHPEPNVTSCNGVCNARILCVASVPAFSGSSPAVSTVSEPPQRSTSLPIQTQPHSYTQQLRDYRKSISPHCQPISVIGTPERKKTPSSSAAPSVVSINNTSTNTNSNTSSGAGTNSNTNTTNTIAGTTNNGSDIQLDLNFSSSDDEADAAGGIAGNANACSSGVGGAGDRVPSPAPSTHTTGSTSTASTAIVGGTPYHSHQDSNPDENDGNQSTMWIGTEDGCIHVYNSTDNIRIKKNRIKIEHHSAVYSILYLDNRVFVSLANGDICVYLRDGVAWNTSSSHCLSIGTVTSPVTKLLSVHGKLWCSIQGVIKVVDIETLLVVNQIQISSDSKPITNMTVSHNYVWVSIQNSAHIKCFHSNSHQLITEVNLAPAVNKMLSNCDEIIRQHKAACLRVTSLLSCRDLIWIGTSAGVLLTIPAQGYEKGSPNVVPTGIPHGHTGHVRFLTFVETTGVSQTTDGSGGSCATTTTNTISTAKESSESVAGNEYKNQSSTKHSKPKPETSNILIISGGDGYEDFRNSGANSLSEIAGREDSTNHLLIWQI